MPGRLDCSARLPNGTDLVRCPDDPAGHHCTRPAGHRPDHVCSCGVVFMLATDHATEVLVTSCWVVEEAEEPLVGAEYHWVLTPRAVGLVLPRPGRLLVRRGQVEGTVRLRPLVYGLPVLGGRRGSCRRR
jgi:hypothetical protein